MNFNHAKINLGCGDKPIPRWVNHDLWFHSPHIDVAWDLNIFPYPWDDNTFNTIRMWDVLEHLDKPVQVINELGRILESGGSLDMRVVGENSSTRWRDPTHKRPFTVGSFDFFNDKEEIGRRLHRIYMRMKWEEIRVKEDAYGSLIVKMIKP